MYVVLTTETDACRFWPQRVLGSTSPAGLLFVWLELAVLVAISPDESSTRFLTAANDVELLLSSNLNTRRPKHFVLNLM